MDGKHITLVTIGTVLMMLVAALRLGGSWNYEDGTSWSRACEYCHAPHQGSLTLHRYEWPLRTLLGSERWLSIMGVECPLSRNEMENVSNWL
jgi:hypothetical protein